MLNKLRAFNREQDLIHRGERVTCAVSGGADSIALLWALYLLKEEWELELHAAHFNHQLRGGESQRDARFVRDFCEGYGIPLHMGSAEITPGGKGLEAAAREARYAFFNTLPGTIATAHTADDNAETLIMHLVRGTGLKGLGGISPRNGRIVRPMLSITRQEVEAFLAEYSLPHVEDSSNSGDSFLRNRLRHHVMPLLKAENPRLCENLSATALRLRQDEAALSDLSRLDGPPDVAALRALPPALRARALEQFLKSSGVREPEAVHLRQAEALVFSDNPSARAHFPGGIAIRRNYGILERVPEAETFPGCAMTEREAETIINTADTFTVHPVGSVFIRSRRAGDTIRLPGGTKSVKKLFIDRKIPADKRPFIPIVCDEAGILGIPGIGVNLDRAADSLPACQLHFKEN